MRNWLGEINSEGGPLIIGDLEDLAQWNGIFGDGSDYDQLFDLPYLNGDPGVTAIRMGDADVIVWEIEGAGTSDVFRTSDGLTVVRSWPIDQDGRYINSALSELPLTHAQFLSHILVYSETLVISWSVEDIGSFVKPSFIDAAIPLGELSVGGSALLVHLSNGRYEVACDKVFSPLGKGRRCRLVKSS
jgi:hypothetical protein